MEIVWQVTRVAEGGERGLLLGLLELFAKRDDKARAEELRSLTTQSGNWWSIHMMGSCYYFLSKLNY